MKPYFAIFLLTASLAFGQSPTNVSAQTKTPRVYLEATYGHVYVSGVDHAVPRLDAYGHNQTMELAKTFLQRCPEAMLTTNENRADFKVSLNWADRTRLFMLGKLLHKPDQIIVTNRDGDVIFSGVARSVGGDTQDACGAIMSAVVPVKHGEPLTGSMNYWTPTPAAPAPAPVALVDAPVRTADAALRSRVSVQRVHARQARHEELHQVDTQISSSSGRSKQCVSQDETGGPFLLVRKESRHGRLRGAEVC